MPTVAVFITLLNKYRISLISKCALHSRSVKVYVFYTNIQIHTHKRTHRGTLEWVSKDEYQWYYSFFTTIPPILPTPSFLFNMNHTIHPPTSIPPSRNWENYNPHCKGKEVPTIILTRSPLFTWQKTDPPWRLLSTMVCLKFNNIPLFLYTL